MVGEDKLLGMVANIYDAAAEPPLWSEFAKQFANAVNGSMGSLLYYDLRCGKATLAISFGCDESCWRQYIDYYSAINPWINAWKRDLNCAGSETVEAGDQRTAFADLKRNEYYNDFLIKHNWAHQVGCVMTKTDETCSAFTCVRSHSAGPFGPAELDLLRLLFPHLQRAMQFHRKMSELEGSYRASLESLDFLPTGVILLDERGRVLEMNRAAARVFSHGDGLAIGKEGLSASTPDQTRELRSKIAGAGLTGKGKGVSAGGSLGIVRPSGKRPFVLRVMPAPANGFAADARRPAAMVFVHDPEANTQTAFEVLARVHHLTPAESRLADRLIQGDSLTLAAELLSITHNTARTHLQRIYQKTDTAHQSELVKVLLSSALTL